MIAQHSIARLECIEPACAAQYAIHQKLYVCPQCGGLLDVAYAFHLAAPAAVLKEMFRQRKASASFGSLIQTPEGEGQTTANRQPPTDGWPLATDASGVWRFRELLPFVTEATSVVTLFEGNTPIYDAPRAARYAGLDAVRFKHQGLNPTGSFKDNGMTTGVTQARTLGAKAVACASTGNTSASMAAYAARAGMQAFVFVPAGQIAYGKLSQALEYGARVVQIEGNFDDAMRLVREIAEATDIYLLNSINPFRLEGQKTIAIEMLEQLGWQVPDWVVVPGGNLGNSSAIGKALRELFELGLISQLPRLAIIQAAGAAPLYEFVNVRRTSAFQPFAHPMTLATAIKIGNPVSWPKALRALEWTNGLVERVSEQEIADAKAIIGSDGIGCEPASAATLAGIKRLVAAGSMASGDSVVAVLTGNLMKDPDYTVSYHTGKLALTEDGHRVAIEGRFANQPLSVAADKEAIKRALDL